LTFDDARWLSFCRIPSHCVAALVFGDISPSGRAKCRP
jgi:hypothetical protein